MIETATHVVGPWVKTHERVVQRCAVCGMKIADTAEHGDTVFWSEGQLIQEYRGEFTAVGDLTELKDTPEDFCLALVEVWPKTPSM